MPWPVIGLPAILTSPAVGVRKPATMLSKVDFPQPDCPTMHRNSEASTLKLTCSTAVTLPEGVSYSNVTSQSSMGSIVGYPFAIRTMPHRCTVARSTEAKTTRSKMKPMTPITTIDAIMMSVCRNCSALKITQPSP